MGNTHTDKNEYHYLPHTSGEGGPIMALVRMDIQSVVVGGGPVASLVILKPRHAEVSSSTQMPIRIGSVEAAAISMGVDGTPQKRPMTHDLLKSVIEGLRASVTSVIIQRVEGTTFYAQIRLVAESGEHVSLDARPSDAIALAVRLHVPILADERVLQTAALPDFGAVERDEREREAEAFHDFVEGLSPDDFAI
jgi:bifunctional DNase/RNase